MRFLGLLFLLVCLDGAEVRAGAWPRAEGEGFMSASVTLRGGQAADEMGAYAEYGLRALTPGLDVNRKGLRTGHALVFARMPVGGNAGTARMAVQVGLGVHETLGQRGGMAKLAGLYGRPWEQGGWIGLEGAVELRAGQPAPLWKLDAVAGFAVRSGPQPMIKLESYYTDGFGFGWTVTSALIFGRSGQPRWVAGWSCARRRWGCRWRCGNGFEWLKNAQCGNAAIHRPRLC